MMIESRRTSIVLVAVFLSARRNKSIVKFENCGCQKNILRVRLKYTLAILFMFENQKFIAIVEILL